MRKTLATIVALSMFTLTACAGSAESTHEFMRPSEPVYAIPDQEPSEINDVLFQNHWFVSGENEIVVNFFGSSSCPPEVETVQLKDTTLYLTPPPEDSERACTDDYGGPYSTIITLKEEDKIKTVIYGEEEIVEFVFD